jgi:Cu(I)/Ag(I) efflux system membrane fusion protein
MDLIPLEDENNEGLDPNAISMSPTAMQLANIQTAVVGYMDPVKKVRLNGKVQSDERLIYSQSSHIPGRIEALMVNFTGDYVQKGQVIASVYSPDLVTAQEELFEAQKIKETQPALFRAAKEKLKNWKLTEEQIQQILESGAAKETFDIRADVSGYVTEKMVNTGDYVGRGQPVFEIADLSRVWILFDVYESDIPWVDRGDAISFTVASLPGETFEGEISFLDPVIDPKTRVAKARVVVSNSGLKLKPEMLASGVFEAELSNQDDNVVVPKSAIMWTGERSVVYVKSESEKGVDFIIRDVTLGPGLGENYIVEEGVEKGEVIAVHGTFSIDAAAQLAGKRSMMNPVSQSEDFTQSEALTTEMPSEPEVDIEPVETNPKFTEQLTDVYEAYLDMKNAFVETNAEKVNTEAKDVIAALENVNMGLLEHDPHMAWMDQLETLNSTIETISNSTDIAEQRKAFSRFNLAFYKSLKMFGLDEKAYFQYCPMANNDQGAYWFSEIEEIRNPYFGDMMMACGENREVIE